MKAIVLSEDMYISGILKAKGTVVFVPDDAPFVHTIIFSTDDEVLQAKINSFVPTFSADVAAGNVSVANLGNGLYQFSRWGIDKEGDKVAVDTLTIKKKTISAIKQNTNAEQTAVKDKYAAAVAELNAMIAACGG